MVDHLGVAKRREIRAGAVLGPRREEADGAGDNGGDEELVVVDCRTAVLIRIDFDVRDLEAGAVVVGAGAEFPVGRGGLCHVPLEGVIEGGAAGFDFLEVGVGIALDGLFGVHAFEDLLVVCFVGRHFDS